MKNPMEECPSFNACGAPRCPLDPDYSIRIRYPEEDKCRAHKPTRNRIALKYPELLPNKGFTPKEASGKKLQGNWD